MHESVQRATARSAACARDLEHYTYRDVSHHMQTIDRYTTLWAEQAFAQGQRAGMVTALFAAGWAFFRNYVLRRGLLLGARRPHRLDLNAYYTYAKLAKLRERARDRRRARMRVLHVDTARAWRGGQNQVLLTARAWRARGHEVVLACRRGGALAARAREAGLDVRAVPFRGDLWPAAAWALARVLREVPPDVVQLHDPHALSAGLLARAPGGRARRSWPPGASTSTLQGALSRREVPRGRPRDRGQPAPSRDVLEPDGIARPRRPRRLRGRARPAAAPGRPRGAARPRRARTARSWSATWPRSPTTRTTRRCSTRPRASSAACPTRGS